MGSNRLQKRKRGGRVAEEDAPTLAEDIEI
jgi:hypothetical protein